MGTRSSQLAQRQAVEVRALLTEKWPKISWETVLFSSPGDRDKKSDLVLAPSDFFTRDLDEALRDGKIDCAIHSAKDMPDSLADGIDFFWLPISADPRDVLVGSLEPNVIGVSSERRIAYAKKRFSNAQLKPLRGTIEERLAQLDAGDFDCVMMAAAALQRLGAEEHIAEWISLVDLPVPKGQGILALTFRAGDERFLRLRSLFVKPVVFVSAGTNAGLCTQAGIAALRRADVCLYDALLDPALLEELPSGAQKCFVGKRSGKHSHEQGEICEMLTRLARQGKRVVRLKGGDAGLYGRLAEEIDGLNSLQLPYRVIPGVSSLSAATTGTGLLLTRRGVADRVQIISGHRRDPSLNSFYTKPTSPSGHPFEEGNVNQTPTCIDFPSGETVALFMGIQSLGQTVERLLEGGASLELPVSVVLNAGRSDQQIVSTPLSEIASKVGPTDLPGLVLVGKTADPKFLYRAHGALRGKRIWLTCSSAIQERAAQAVFDFGGVPIQQPLIELVPEVCPRLGLFDWLIVTSPSAVRCLMEQLDDFRVLPKVLCCGIGTAKALSEFRVQPNAMPEGEFNTQGVLEAAQKQILKGARILRVCSDRAGETLSEKLRETFAQVEDCVICRNRAVVCNMPTCDVVFFASVSAVESFIKQFGVEKLEGKEVVVIGKMDAAALQKHSVGNIVAPKQSTVEGAVEALAISSVWKEF